MSQVEFTTETQSKRSLGLQLDQPKRAVIYLRVSTESQVNTDIDPEGFSIPAQRKSCERKAAQLGAEIIETYIEPGRSGRTIAKREAFQEMMSRIRTQRDVDYVIVYKLSRLNRNRYDDAIIGYDLKKHGATLISATEQIDDSAVGQMMHGILAAFNEYRSREDGDDIRYKMGEKAKRGGTVSKAPIGYLNVKRVFDGREINTVITDPERAPLLKLAFEMFATGAFSITELVEEIGDRGLVTRPGKRLPSKPLSDTQVTRILSNRYYIGKVVFEGQEFEGRHDPLIDAHLFEQVQLELERRTAGHIRKRVHPHYLKGTLWCWSCHERGVDYRLVRQRAVGASGIEYQYFFCRGRQDKVCNLRHVEVLDLEDAVERFFDRIRLSDELVAVIRCMIKTVVEEQADSSKIRKRQIEKQLLRLDTQESNLLAGVSGLSR